MWIARSLSILLLILLSGCMSFRVGVGPSLDTDGRLGVEGRLTMAVGFGDGDAYLGAGPYVGVAELGEEGERTTTTYGGAIMASGTLEDRDPFVLHAELSAGGRASKGLDDNLVGVGLQLGVGYDVRNERSRFRDAIVVGAALRAEYVGGRGTRGMFTLPIFVNFVPVTPFGR